MNTLEKFVENNRDAFDSEEPSADLWQKIDQQLPATPVVVRPMWFQHPFTRYVAAAVIVLAMGWGVYQMGRYSRDKELADADTPQPALTQVNIQAINPELAQAEMYYTSLIQEQKSLLNPEELKSLGLQDDFSKDLRTLDSLYLNLKKELLSEPNKDQIVVAMIQNLQLRVELLKKQIQTLQRIRKYRRDTLQADEPVPART